MPDADTAPFWEGVSAGVLRIQECDRCGTRIFYPRLVCPNCLSSELTWIDSSGQGTVYSFTVVHRAPPGFEEEAPFAVALIDLDEGVRLMGRLDSASPRIGARVHAAFRPNSDGLILPYFRETDANSSWSVASEERAEVA